MQQKVLILFSLLTINLLIGQENKESNLYEWFDNEFSKQNLDLNNGLISMETYTTLNNSNQYLKDSKFSLGTVKFDNQIYSDVFLNYDAYKDALLFKPNGESDLRAVNCLKGKNDFFIIDNRKFVNLNLKYNEMPDFINGYYEENIIGSNLILYTKHQKKRTESISNTKVYSDFSSDIQFFIFYKNVIHKFNESSAKSIFPNLKNQIEQFYSDNYSLNKTNKKQFSENLLHFINAELTKN